MYIVLVVSLLLCWMFLPEQGLCGPRSFRVLLVGLCYLSIGAAFGFIYHDLYSAGAASFNWLLDHAVNDPEQQAREQEEAVSTGQHRSHVKPAESRYRQGDGLPLNLTIPPGSLTVALLRRRSQAIGVFAQDRPAEVLDASYSMRHTELFRGSFQFPACYRLTEIDPCARLSFLPKREYHDARIVSIGCEKAIPVGPSPDCTISPNDGAPEQPIQTNDTVQREFVAALTGIQKQEYPAGEIAYEVWFHCGADRRPVPGDVRVDGNGNQQIAARRGQAVKDLLYLTVNAYIGEQGKSASPELLSLASAIFKAGCQPIVQTKDNNPLAVLWPAADPKELDTAVGEAPWRAVGVYADRLVPDVGSAAKMSMELNVTTSFTDLLYFSFVAFTTTGYGDIRPISNEARLWTSVENILELVFTAMLFVTAMKQSPRRWPEPPRAAGTDLTNPAPIGKGGS